MTETKMRFVLVALGLLIALPSAAQQRQQAPVIADADRQAAFLRIIDVGWVRYQGAPNDMARGAVRPERAQMICQVLPRANVSGWVGRIERLSSTANGHGVLRVRLDARTVIQTLSRETGDERLRTLIPPGSPLFQRVANMQVGQRVLVSGSFVRDPEDCVKEMSLTVRGGMEEPTFLFGFSDVRPAE